LTPGGLAKQAGDDQAAADVTSETPAIRASDSEREHTVELLRRHSVDGRLTLEEFADRIERAYEARTRDELEELTHDLPATAAKAPERRERRASRWIVSVMGGTQKRGRWRLARDTNVVCVMGGAELDLREAELDDLDSTITVVAVMGGAEITVPEGVDVDVGGFAFMGGREFRPARTPPPPSAPSLTIKAYALMGGIEVRTR
jgi:Domain of unknown function (DUF1707)/Cell wall-active antibiotics response 4TMS YvqF